MIIWVINMKVYVDVIMLVNFFFDFLILLSLSLLLKRNVPLKKILLGVLTGGVSIVFLFIPLNSFSLLFFKIIISIFMVIITFNYKNFKYFLNNLFYLYVVSIILGGLLYFIDDAFSYRNTGLIFYHTRLKPNFIIMLFLAIFLLFVYVKKEIKYKEERKLFHEVEITFLNNKKLTLEGFLDTGNSLLDPYKKRPIILIQKDVLQNYHPRMILVPCNTISSTNFIKCFRIKKISLDKKVLKEQVLVGISDNNFNIDGVECLLNINIKELVNEKNN